ncbi:hypothetical protein J6590_018242 [Homalodisca vitripennis]|nr:hypothetical protein J6590_018242 [Homalodisca vitripennis]
MVRAGVDATTQAKVNISFDQKQCLHVFTPLLTAFLMRTPHLEHGGLRAYRAGVDATTQAKVNISYDQKQCLHVFTPLLTAFLMRTPHLEHGGLRAYRAGVDATTQAKLRVLLRALRTGGYDVSDFCNSRYVSLKSQNPASKLFIVAHGVCQYSITDSLTIPIGVIHIRNLGRPPAAVAWQDTSSSSMCIIESVTTPSCIV